MSSEPEPTQYVMVYWRLNPEMYRVENDSKWVVFYQISENDEIARLFEMIDRNNGINTFNTYDADLTISKMYDSTRFKIFTKTQVDNFVNALEPMRHVREFPFTGSIVFSGEFIKGKHTDTYLDATAQKLTSIPKYYDDAYEMGLLRLGGTWANVRVVSLCSSQEYELIYQNLTS